MSQHQVFDICSSTIASSVLPSALAGGGHQKPQLQQSAKTLPLGRVQGHQHASKVIDNLKIWHGQAERTRVEVNVGVKVALDKVIVGARSLLQRDSHLNERVAPLNLKHLLRHITDDGRARVVVFVNPAAPVKVGGVCTATLQIVLLEPRSENPMKTIYKMMNEVNVYPIIENIYSYE